MTEQQETKFAYWIASLVTACVLGMPLLVIWLMAGGADCG